MKYVINHHIDYGEPYTAQQNILLLIKVILGLSTIACGVYFMPLLVLPSVMVWIGFTFFVWWGEGI